MILARGSISKIRENGYYGCGREERKKKITSEFAPAGEQDEILGR